MRDGQSELPREAKSEPWSADSRRTFGMRPDLPPEATARPAACGFKARTREDRSTGLAGVDGWILSPSCNPEPRRPAYLVRS